MISAVHTDKKYILLFTNATHLEVHVKLKINYHNMIVMYLFGDSIVVVRSTEIGMGKILYCNVNQWLCGCLSFSGLQIIFVFLVWWIILMLYFVFLF